MIESKKSSLEKWLKHKKNAAPKESIEVQEEHTPTVLSYSQKRLWLLQKLFPDNPFYQYGHIYRFRGHLNIDFLQQSFRPLTEKYSILRTTFQETAQGPRQVAQASSSLHIEVEDLSAIPQDQQIQQAEQIIRTDLSKTFDLTQLPLIRLKLLRFSETSHWLVLNMHHIVIDRWSLDLINKEISGQYLALKNNEPVPELSPLPFQYSDYARWQQNQKVSDKDLDYWLKKLSGDLPSFSFPPDFPRPAIPSYQGAMLNRPLSTELTHRLRAFCKEANTTMYVVLLSAFKAVLHLYSDQNDILVGSPFSNRDKSSLEQIVGLFNETVVLRTAVSAEISFRALVEKVKTTTFEALAHKNVPFETLVQKLNPERQGSHNPLFQVMFSYKTMVPPPDFGEDIQVEEDTLDMRVAKFDLTLYGLDSDAGLVIDLVYATDLYKAATAERLMDYLEMFLEEVTHKPDIGLGQISLLNPAEKKLLINDWNNTQAQVPDKSGIHQFMENQALRHPTRKAVVFQGAALSYSDLNAQAEAVAQKLLSLGVQADTPVGLYCRRSIEMVVGIFGILKAGAAYLPLDPEYPAERIAFMLSDSETSLILSQEELTPQLPGTSGRTVITFESIASNPTSSSRELPSISPDQLAYIIYTSGSTGLPKGVPITHANLIHSTAARFSFYPEDPSCFLLMSSFSFDSSVAGIFWSLCSGGKLLLAKKRIEQDIDELSQLIFQHGVTHTLMLPSLYTLLLAHSPAERLRSLNSVIVAGEACPNVLVHQHFQCLPAVKLYNEYGPTEASVWCIAHEIQPADQHTVPIGRPIDNTQVYILNKALKPVPIGAAGELYIAGNGLASGYLNRPELSRERFIRNPFSEDQQVKMYKTGDLARYTDIGIIEFLGRADHQIKIRGHRVEPDEIAALLLNFPNLKEAVVIARQSNELKPSAYQLIAYFNGIEADQIDELREFLRVKLPDYMIPAALIRLETFPRLPNGKIDRKALPAPEETDFVRHSEFVPPGTELEIQLAEIWQQILQKEQIGINDNFFDIGGDSILSIQIVAQARKAGLSLAANQLFQHQTIAELSKSITEKDPDIHSSLVPLKKNGQQSPLFCIHSGGAHVFFYQALAKNFGADRPLYALQPKGLEKEGHYHAGIEDMAAFYIQEIKQVQSNGPYHILGTCFSNAVALEMAKQLRGQGEEIAKLFIIDSAPVHLLGNIPNNKKLTTLKRFWGLVRRGDLYRIKQKISNRFKSTNKRLERLEKIKPEKDLREMIESLNGAYNQYNWSPFSGKIDFIRSSEFHNRSDKKYHLQQWNKLAKNGLDIHVVPGHHLTLFEEPEVQGLAQKLEACLREH